MVESSGLDILQGQDASAKFVQVGCASQIKTLPPGGVSCATGHLERMFCVTRCVTRQGKMGRFLITRDDGKNCSKHLDGTICAERRTGANSCQNSVLA